MVRHKSRWLLVRIDWETDVNCTSPGSNEIITARDIYLELRNLVQTVFGISGAAMTHDLQGKSTFIFNVNKINLILYDSSSPFPHHNIHVCS